MAMVIGTNCSNTYDKKFHVELKFDVEGIQNIIRELKEAPSLSKRVTFHFKEQCERRHINVPSLTTVLSKGEVFEYKMLGNQIKTLAFRLRGEKWDKCFILSPVRKGDGIEVAYITAYKNSSDDCHTTLRKEEYEQ